VTAATTEIPCQVAGDRLAVVEAVGKYAGQGVLIGGWVITSFEKIARGPSYRARGVAVFSFSGCLDVRRDRIAWNLTLGSTPSRAEGRRLHRGAAVLAEGRSGGCGGTPAGSRLAIGWSFGRATLQESVEEQWAEGFGEPGTRT
jgi:hypothetical protein